MFVHWRILPRPFFALLPLATSRATTRPAPDAPGLTVQTSLFDPPQPPEDPRWQNHPLLVGLNPQQRQAVTTTQGPLLVLAGAGSGKTRVITHRMAWLVTEERVSPWQILAMTFTNKAAGEMRERVAHTVGPGAKDIWLGTFHSIGVRMLRMLAREAGLQPSFSIYDTDDQLRTINRVMKALHLSDATYKPRQFAQYIDRAKNRLRLPGDKALQDEVESEFDKKALAVYAAYEQEMRTADAVDFGDLILRPAMVLAQNPGLCQVWSQRFRYVLVDEFQDTNAAQFELLKLLTSGHHNLCVVGDDDQSIYSWRGAEVGNILGFPQMFPNTTVVKLERNYRSTGHILAASTAVVSHNRSRHGKVLWTESGDGEKLVLHVAGDEREEADWVARTLEEARRLGTPLSDMAVFYRTNAQSRVLEESMRRFRLAYVLIGGQRFYERAEVKDMLSWLRVLCNPSDSAGWERAIQSPRRGIGDATIDLVTQHARSRGISLPEAADELVRLKQAGRSGEKLQQFQHLLESLRDGMSGLRADTVGAQVLQASGLKAALQADKDPDAQDRLENLGQLLAAMSEHADSAEDPTLRGFLEQVALVADTDKLGDTAKVSMMTMHSAKGLEFDVAIVVGLEEGILPHANSISGTDGRDMEEERRLLYVGMTRARKRLFLSHARARRKFGGPEMMAEPSRFLAQIPEDHLDVRGTRPVAHAWTGGQNWSGGGSSARAGRQGAWGPQRPTYGVQSTQRASQEEPVFARGNPDSPYQPGAWVKHASFGRGQVLDAEGYGSEAKLTVRFDKVGVKKLVAKYVHPG